MVSGFLKEDQERKVGVVLKFFGEKVILMNISEECRKKDDDVLTKFDAYFKALKNIMFKRAWFNCRTQKVDKSV